MMFFRIDCAMLSNVKFLISRIETMVHQNDGRQKNNGRRCN